jgi:hypothetical protein
MKTLNNYDENTLIDTETGLLYDRKTKQIVGQHNT